MEIEKQSIKEWRNTLNSVDPKSKNAKIAKRILKLASLPRRRRVIVDLKKLSQIANEGESVIVPGKVLSTGPVAKKFSLSAIEYSASATKKLKDAGCTIVKLGDALKAEKPKLVI